MEFRTIMPLVPREPKIDHNSQIFLLGSCFVENIGQKLEYFKFRNLQNPFGILFHPVAISTFLGYVKEQKIFSEKEIFYHNERWNSYDAHSALSSSDKEELLQAMNSAIVEAHEFLEKATHVIITPGTAWGYKLKATGKTVANCHKVPQREFEKVLMEVYDQMSMCVEFVRNINPGASVIFTVSPIRHLKDGFVENQQSKSRLISAVHRTISENDNTHYFPSYELMLDDLRDYRFYSDDMLHPSPLAIEYIWNRFSQTYMTSETISVMEEVGQIQRGLAHRPFHENSEAHRIFLEKLQQKMERLQQRYSTLRF